MIYILKKIWGHLALKDAPSVNLSESIRYYLHFLIPVNMELPMNQGGGERIKKGQCD